MQDISFVEGRLQYPKQSQKPLFNDQKTNEMMERQIEREFIKKHELLMRNPARKAAL